MVLRLAFLVLWIPTSGLAWADEPPESPGLLRHQTVGSRASSLAPSPSPTPALSLDGQLHLGPAGDIFRDGEVFLWTSGFDERSLALGLQTLTHSTGTNNTAVGHRTMYSDINGIDNSAFGTSALQASYYGSYNSAFGSGALLLTESNYHSAFGAAALLRNTTGDGNSAFGERALFANTTGNRNSAVGQRALWNVETGSYNIALGHYAGQNLEEPFAPTGASTYSWNILIGHEGYFDDQGTIRIGREPEHTATHIAGIFGQEVEPASAVAVRVDANGKLGTIRSSRRYKESITPIGRASTRLMDLRPVTFRFKTASENDSQPLQFGLIAEEVAETFPELVVYDRKGRAETVRYDLLSSLLLNEVQRQSRRIGLLSAMMAVLLAAGFGLVLRSRLSG